MNPFSFSENLVAGDTIDFFVAGTSTTADLNSLSTGFDATITEGPTTTGVPEPATLGLMGLGLAAAAFARRRRKS